MQKPIDINVKMSQITLIYRRLDVKILGRPLNVVLRALCFNTPKTFDQICTLLSGSVVSSLVCSSKSISADFGSYFC